ncbi:MAG TPA: ABC transporter permease [Actinomycetota bacterium]|nr:ABC transporter permease [Actinomycetota bacterium]
MFWQVVFFAASFYVILAVAFGTYDFFRNALPVFQPWWWDFSTFLEQLDRIFGGFYQAVYLRTLGYVFVASALCLLIGYPIAYFVARYAGRRKGLFLILLIMPFWISYLMRMYAWQSLLERDGYVNDILMFFQLLQRPFGWLEGHGITVVMGLVYGYLPYLILPLYGQLDRIDQAQLEAGRDLGASPFKTFWRVTLPLSKPGILAGLIIITLPMVGDYYTNNLLSQSPRTSMIGNAIDFTYSTAGLQAEGASLVLTVVVLLIVPMLWYLRYTARAAEAK